MAFVAISRQLFGAESDFGGTAAKSFTAEFRGGDRVADRLSGTQVWTHANSTDPEATVFHSARFTNSGIVPVALTFAALATTACGEQAAPTNPLHGVWSMTAITDDDGAMIEPSQPGLFIFTEGYYSAVYSLGADLRMLSATAFVPTTDEMLAQYQTIIVNTGTYDVTGSTITYRPRVAKSPEFVGGHSTMDYVIEGDVLTLSTTSVVSVDGVSPPEGIAGTIRLRRLE